MRDICRYKYMFTFQVIFWKWQKKGGVTGLLIAQGQSEMFFQNADYRYPQCHSQDELLPPNIFFASYTWWALLTSFYKWVSNLQWAGLWKEQRTEETRDPGPGGHCVTSILPAAQLFVHFQALVWPLPLGLCAKCVLTAWLLLWNSKRRNSRPMVN